MHREIGSKISGNRRKVQIKIRGRQEVRKPDQHWGIQIHAGDAEDGRKQLQTSDSESKSTKLRSYNYFAYCFILPYNSYY